VGGARPFKIPFKIVNLKNSFQIPHFQATILIFAEIENRRISVITSVVVVQTLYIALLYVIIYKYI
jgi:hypothetical protein